MSKQIKKEIIRKVYLDELPKYGEGRYKGKINWKESVGYKIKFIYEDIEGQIEIIEYAKTKLKIKYNGYEKYIYINHFKNGHIGNILNKITLDFKFEIGIILKDDKRDFIIIDREYRPTEIIFKNGRKTIQNVKWYKYHCNICTWNEGWITECHITQNVGCSCCSGHTLIQGINDIPTVSPWMIPYFQGGIEEAKLYTKYGGGNPNNPRGLIQPICPDCNRIKNSKIAIQNIYTRHKISCICGDGISYPNKLMFNILEQLNINFIKEYSPEWIKPKRYDFYIPSMNLIIEMDGGLGHGKKVYSNSKVTSEESLEIDNYKDNMAIKHGISKPIRINCDLSEINYIKNKILDNGNLNKLFDFSIINWEEADKFALSNLVKIVCEIKKNNTNITIKEIAKIVDISITSVRNYLNKGKGIWL